MSRDIDLQFGHRLRRRRRLMGFTQKELGALCGVRFQQIQKYESAANRISASMIVRLARALRVEVTYFYDGIAEATQEAPQGRGIRLDPPGTGSEAA